MKICLVTNKLKDDIINAGQASQEQLAEAATTNISIAMAQNKKIAVFKWFFLVLAILFFIIAIITFYIK